MSTNLFGYSVLFPIRTLSTFLLSSFLPPLAHKRSPVIRGRIIDFGDSLKNKSKNFALGHPQRVAPKHERVQVALKDKGL